MARGAEGFADSRWPRWFIFGESADGFVDISDGQKDVASRIPRKDAEALILEHNKLREALVNYLQSMPWEEWYRVNGENVAEAQDA